MESFKISQKQSSLPITPSVSLENASENKASKGVALAGAAALAQAKAITPAHLDYKVVSAVQEGHEIRRLTVEELIAERVNDSNDPFEDKLENAIEQGPSTQFTGKTTYALVNRARIYRKALELARQNPNILKGKVEQRFLSPSGLTKGAEIPSHLTLKAAAAVRSSSTPGYMTYGSEQNVGENQALVKVDFANKFLGGGWFGKVGWVQEEQMVAEVLPLMLTCAQAAVEKRHTREGEAAAGKGIGTPILIRGEGMVSAPIPDGVKKGGGIHLEQSDADLLATEIHTVPFGVLAMAAPRVRNRAADDKEMHLTVLRDLFQTAYTGFSGAVAANQADGKQTVIETGLWGAGDFGNTPADSLQMQYLAARVAGVDEIRFRSCVVKGEDEGLKAIAAIDHLINEHPDFTVEQLLKTISGGTTGAADRTDFNPQDPIDKQFADAFRARLRAEFRNSDDTNALITAVANAMVDGALTRAAADAAVEAVEVNGTAKWHAGKALDAVLPRQEVPAAPGKTADKVPADVADRFQAVFAQAVTQAHQENPKAPSVEARGPKMVIDQIVPYIREGHTRGEIERQIDGLKISGLTKGSAKEQLNAAIDESE